VGRVKREGGGGGLENNYDQAKKLTGRILFGKALDSSQG